METIFALATPEGKSGVAIVRLSGPASWDAVERLVGRVPAARQASLRRLIARDGTYLDDALVLTFENGASFTGERSAEFHVHGSIAIVRALLRELSQMPSLRQAEPGEFTRRSMENGRFDLTQVEALADLIESETELQRKQALAVHSGALGERIAVWRRDLIRAAALLEATIDFADEEVPVDVTEEVLDLLHRTDLALAKEIEGSHTAERVRTGFEVAIVGPPNVGKSSLLNRLAGRDAAITSEVAGTTRDVIEVRMDLDGLPVTLLDTAGLRETEDVVESMGIDRAVARASVADMRVILVSEGTGPSIEVQPGDLVKESKNDITGNLDGISVVTGHGIDGLMSEIRTELVAQVATSGLASRERHRSAMTEGRVLLASALEKLRQGPDLYDIAVEDIRVVINRLGAVIGVVDVEHILDEIFSSFCLGK